MPGMCQDVKLIHNQLWMEVASCCQHPIMYAYGADRDPAFLIGLF